MKLSDVILNEELNISRDKLIQLADSIGKENLLNDILDIKDENVLDMLVDELAKMYAPKGP